jgi:hypothetical protein
MKKFLTLILLLVSLTAFSQKQHEKFYQNIAAERMHGRTEVVLDDRTRADIVTDTFAIEVEFAHKWAESIGQSLHYAHKLHKKAGIVLITDGRKDDRFVQILMPDAVELGITVWVIFINDNSWGKVEPLIQKDSTVKFIY